MLKSNSVDHKMGAMLAINRIVKIGRETRIVHNVKKIMKDVLAQLTSSNKDLVEMAAQCLGILAEAGGKNIAETIDAVPHEVIRYLTEDRDPRGGKDLRRYAAVLVLKEFCKKLSIVTFNKLFDTSKNISLIFEAMKDQRPHVRTTAADCINECISLINRREYNNELKKKYTSIIYAEVRKALDQEQDVNYLQSALSIIGELIQIKSGSHSAAQSQNVIIQSEGKLIEKILKLISENKSSLIGVRRQCVQLLPQLIRHLPAFQEDLQFQLAMGAIFGFMRRKEKVQKEAVVSKGCGFVALGKISQISTRQQFARHLPDVLDLVEEEIVLPPGFCTDHYCKPL